MILVLVVYSFTSFSQPKNINQNAPLDMSTPFANFKQLCNAITKNDRETIARLTTEEGYRVICEERGVQSLQIDVIFWLAALEDGQIFSSEKIESEKEFLLLQDVEEYQILCVNSLSGDKYTLIEKLTFIKEDGQWKFLLFSSWEK